MTFSTSIGYTFSRPGDDHVLDPVGEEQVALVVEVAGVAGAEPAVLGDGLRGLLRAGPVAGRVLARPDPDLADLAARRVLAGRGVDDLELHPRVRLAGRAHEVGARAVRVVVLGVELGDRAGGLGGAVDLEQRRLNVVSTRSQHGRRDRRGAVGDGPQLRPVAVGGAGHLHEELQHRRHEEGVGDALVGHGGEQLVGDDVGDEHHARARTTGTTSAKPEPPMWNSGIATRPTDWVSKPQWSPTESSAANWVWVSTTPLGRPVVPEV